MRITYANVLSTVAVFVALGGSAYAAAQLTGGDVKNGSLTGRDVKNNSIKSADVRNGQLRRRDFRNEALLRGSRGRRGPAGPQGPSGATTRWLLINENGDIEEQSGGFTVVSKPGTNGQPATNPNYYVDAGSSLVGEGLTGTIAIQNRIDRTGDGMADPAFAGDVAVGRCNTAAITCVPTGTNVDNVFVVRSLADNTSTASQTRRVYVTVTS